MNGDPAPKLPCPYCGDWYSRVEDTDGVYRVRVCLTCGTDFHTIEILRTQVRELKHRPPKIQPFLPFVA